MSNATEIPVKDFNIDEPTIAKVKINYKEAFITLNDGDNLIRFIDPKGKKIGTHWVKDKDGKQRSVKCPVTGCPCCKANVPTAYKTFMKVVDKLGNVRIFEFGSQIANQLKRIALDLKEEDPNAMLTQRDVIINRGPRGSNPLYNVKLVKVNAKPAPSEILRQQAIEEAITKDTLDLSEIVVPWTVKRINEYIYGIKEEGEGQSVPDTSFEFGANVGQSVTAAPAPARTASAPATAAKKTGEDLSMFE